MAIQSYESYDMLLKQFLLPHPFVPYISMLVGMFACKLKLFQPFKDANALKWNNRAISTVHALFITAMSLYLVFWSDLYSDQQLNAFVTLQSSPLSTFALGVSVGYFLTDLGMIIWFYPALGGLEYVVHHLLSVASVAYAMLTGEGQLYTYMVLISETTTPGINLRWYLDTTGMKGSRTYLINGVVIFIAWLVARILLFMYLFYHLYLHYQQVKQMHIIGKFLAFGVPPILAVMNVMWFGKIFKGLKKTLAKSQ
ncbi:unnamed protein product [Prunus armeniaca]|uniref:TLC domain-containing protein n=1 Tax=Prunus armeniaca TaxID=36596 RepID=A0A6J5WWI8_PRUAR|nr:unnamed protein product [Prunus armeniaca]